MDTATGAATAVAAPIAAAAAPLTTAVGGAVVGVTHAMPVSSTDVQLPPHLHRCTTSSLCLLPHVPSCEVASLAVCQGSNILTDVDMNFVAVKSKGIFVALIGLCLVIAIGAVFYASSESLKWIDAVYFTVVTATTVGFGDYCPESASGECSPAWRMPLIHLAQLQLSCRESVCMAIRSSPSIEPLHLSPLHAYVSTRDMSGEFSTLTLCLTYTMARVLS